LHKFRATGATRYFQRAMPLPDIMALGGWRDMKSVMRYMGRLREPHPKHSGLRLACVPSWSTCALCRSRPPNRTALSRAFRDCGACFLAIVHHNKRNDVDAVQKILGAASVAGAVRAAWGFSRDPDNKEEFYMARVKNNLSKKLGGMKYKISEKKIGDIVAPHVEWLGEADETANEVMDKEREAATGRRENRKIDMARLFLKNVLARGPRRQSEIEAEAEKEGINSWTLRMQSAN